MSVDEHRDRPGQRRPTRPEPHARRAARSAAGRSCSSWSVALVAAVVAQQNESSGSSDVDRRRRSRGTRRRIGVPAADVASSAWYCAAGTSTPDGDADRDLVIASLARTDIEVTVTVMPGGDTAPATERMRLAPGEEVNVPVADVLATAEPGVVGRERRRPGRGRRTCSSTTATSRSSRAPAPPNPTGTSPRAPPSTAAQHDLVLFNPFGDDAIVDISFVTDTGVQEPAGAAGVVVPATLARHRPGAGLGVAPGARSPTHVHARSGPRRRRADPDRSTDVVVDGADPQRASRSRSARPRPHRRGGSPPARRATAAEPSSRWPTSPSDDTRVDVKTSLVGGQKVPVQTVRVPSQGVAVVDVDHSRPARHRHRASSPPHARSTAGASRWWRSCWRRGRRRRRAPAWGARSARPSPPPGGSCPCPTSTPTTTVTVFNPGPEPVTAELLAADLVDRRVGCHQRARAGDPARCGPGPCASRWSAARPRADGRHRQPSRSSSG